ncbi:MAG: AAA family ATPase [Thermodesulfovibrionales bacterium]|jgi:general secretion pathway protein A|nr:AAA family ATPase [Thermodesulfovibrionales bacterium]
MDYLEFFDLKEDPFRLTPDPYYFYPSESHNEALSSFNYIVEQKEGFFMCVGDPGTGKTTLLNTFLNTEKWKDRAGIALVLTPRLSPEEFLLTILEDLNVKVKNTNKNEIIKAFRDFLIENSMIGRRIIIIVDEAQNLPNETLEELRLLSNLETEKEKLLQIVLIGQPELRDRLLSDSLKQLNQRITVRATLRPLTINETSDYINYRLVKAGKGTVIFEEKTKKLIHKLSKGIPRLINLVSSRAMMAAYLDMSRYVRKRHVMYAVKHVSDSFIKTTRRIVTFPRIIVYSLMVCLIVAALIVMNRMKEHDPASLSNKRQASIVERRAPDAENTTYNAQRTTHNAVVAVDAANVRAKPSLNSETIGSVSKETVLEIIDEFTETTGKKWYKVKMPDGKEGWIADKTVKIANGS